ncbi:hypothetical protein T03_5822 [Trichinella britovi]|uniref:Uncharacterized protein n=1 Tax=Trichinella britovi TaxID=45882 RepID=A0A0V1B9P3_TRIBR|nr:hypothetical protein T03_5822 [Trichinella britovi]KRZ81313.1 hypothetical protein T08_10334 [Trichinella sp. T8]
MDKLLHKMWDNGLVSGRAHQLFKRKPGNERSLTLKLKMVLRRSAVCAS